MSETKPKKMVSRSVAIALGIICIILLASLFGVILSYEQQIHANDHATFGMDKSIVYFGNETIDENVTWLAPWAFEFSENPYAGYFSVDIKSSTNKTYVLAEWTYPVIPLDELNYRSYKISYENMTYVGTNGTVNFPILPNTNGAIIIGNNNTNSEAIITFSITLHY